MRKISLLFLAFLLTGIIKSQSLAVSASVIQNVSCYGGSNGIASSTPSGGTAPYTYLWLPVGRTTQTIAALTAATYTVRVTDHIGNTVSASATVTQPSTLGLSASAKASAICPGQSDSLFSTGSGGTIPYSYMWNGPVADISCPTCQNTNAYPYGAAYVVTAVNDANGCTASASVSITVHPFPYVTIEGPLSPVTTFSNDTLISLSPGASSYLWSNSATTSTIIVSPAVTTTYSVTTTNTYGCYDTAHYTVSPNSSGNGKTSSNAISVSPGTNLTTTSYSSLDSVVWFKFIPTDSNNQIIANSAFLGMPVPHVHRLTLYNSSLQMLVDEPMPDIVGANQIRIDISHLHPGSSYFVRAARTPAQSNMPGCNSSSAHECNPGMRWDFQMCFRTVPVFVPNDSGSEAPSISQLYYEDRGQISDLNDIPRFDVKAYTNIACPAVYASDSALSFVYGSVDSMQRVDMTLTGAYVQPSQPVYKMQEDSNAGYLNYFKEFIENGVPKIEGYFRLVYKNVYPNLDMQVYSNGDGTKFYFVCNPASGGNSAGNPADIELQFNGANSVSVTGSGGLNVNTSFGTLNFTPAYAYTDSAGIIKPKSWQPYFVTVNSNTVKFNTGSYNTNEPLVIRFDRGHYSPQSYPPQQNMDWNTYYGGTNAGNNGLFRGVTTDAAGNIDAVGYTNATHFPVRNSFVQFKGYKGDTDAVIVKFNGATDSVLWATYYGGSGMDLGLGIATDANNNVYVTGSTNSTNFPLANYSGGSYMQGTLNGTGSGPNTDAFILAIDPTGLRPLWATYYGGFGIESGHAIAVDKLRKEVYIVGDADTASPHLYAAGAYNDSNGSALIAKFYFNTFSGAYVRTWGVDMGQPHLDSSGFNSCAVDQNSNFYVAGASGADYPTTDYGYSGRTDMIYTQFDVNGNMAYSTYLGGPYKDLANGITVDIYGNVYITGHSYSYSWGEFAANNNSWMYLQNTNGNNVTGNGNAFIAEFNNTSGFAWFTFFGGVGDIDGAAITTDNNGDVYITGDVMSNDSAMIWPASQPAGAYYQVTPPSIARYYQGFIAAFNIGGGYYWGTYGACGNINSAGYGIAAYQNQKLYAVGSTAAFVTYPFVQPNTKAYLQTTTGNATSVPYISGFNISGIPTGVNELSTPVTKNIKVYPNPTNDNVTVQICIQQPGNVQFTLYSLLGEPIYSNVVYESAAVITEQIPLANLPNGNYILQVIHGNQVEHAKITKLQ